MLNSFTGFAPRKRCLISLIAPLVLSMLARCMTPFDRPTYRYKCCTDAAIVLVSDASVAVAVADDDDDDVLSDAISTKHRLEGLLCIIKHVKIIHAGII
jgi:hypothetical protein